MYFSIVYPIVAIGLLIIAIAGNAAAQREHKAAIAPMPNNGPYRTPAKIPVPIKEPEPKPIKQPKPKREFKMSLTNFQRKVLHSFLWLVPVLGAIVAIGILYDLSIPGVGVRVACGFAAGIIGAFCFIMCLHTATDGFSG